MNTPYTHDAIIIGGGMVGLSLAVAASQQGLSVAIVERQEPEHDSPEPGRFAPRVSAISRHSRHWLDRLGAWRHIPAGRACAYDHMMVWDGQGNGEIAFDANDVQAESLGHIVENRWLTQSLWQAADTSRSIHPVVGRSMAHWEQDADAVRVELDDGEQLSTPVLAACDGRFSTVREQAGFQTREWAYGQTALVTSIRHSQPHASTARQVFLDTGPLAFLPLSDETGTDHWTSIVWSADSDRAQALAAMEDDTFLAALNQASQGCLGTIEAADPRFSFPLGQMHAREYWRNRVVLLGDAAHAIHPLAGQGVNLGFQDAEALADVWGQARQQGLSLGDAWTLRRFQRRRQAHNLSAMAAMEGFKRLFGTDHPAPVLLRNRGLNWINRLPLAKRPLIQAAMGEFG